MSIVLFVVVLAVSFIIGTFGFSQIIGSLQNVGVRGIGVTLFTIILWGAVIVGSFFLMKHIQPDKTLPFLIGMGASFIAVLSQGRIS